jgi:hypothetical protein
MSWLDEDGLSAALVFAFFLFAFELALERSRRVGGRRKPSAGSAVAERHAGLRHSDRQTDCTERGGRRHTTTTAGSRG